MPLIVSGVVLLLVIAGSAYAITQKDAGASGVVATQNEGVEVTKEGVAEQRGDSMPKVEGAVAQKGSYEAYAPDKVARAKTGDVILFFHASWCPSCHALNASIERSVMAIPEGVSILKVNYDKETELKQKYGVTYQHTLVQVDENGKMIKKWSGSPDLDSLLSQIQ